MGGACSKNKRKGPKGSINKFNSITAELNTAFKEDLAESEKLIPRKNIELLESLKGPDDKRVLANERELVSQLYYHEQLVKRFNSGVTTCQNLRTEEYQKEIAAAKATVPEKLKFPLQDLLATTDVAAHLHPQKYQKPLFSLEDVLKTQFGDQAVTNAKKYDLIKDEFRPEQLRDWKPTDDQLDYRLFQFCEHEKLTDFAKIDQVGHHVGRHAPLLQTPTKGEHPETQPQDVKIELDKKPLQLAEIDTVKSGKESLQGGPTDTPKFFLAEGKQENSLTGGRQSHFKENQSPIREEEEEKKGEVQHIEQHGARESYMNQPGAMGLARDERISAMPNRINDSPSKWSPGVEDEDMSEGDIGFKRPSNMNIRKSDLAHKSGRQSHFGNRLSFNPTMSQSGTKAKRVTKSGMGETAQEVTIEETYSLHNPVLSGVALLKHKYDANSEIFAEFAKQLVENRGSHFSGHGFSQGEKGRRSVLGHQILAAEDEEGYKNVSQQLAAKKEKFSDSEFAIHTPNVIMHRPDKAINAKDMPRYRPSDSLDKFSKSIFGDHALNAHSVGQGYLSDSDFASVLAALAENPKVVRNLLSPGEFNPEGMYSVALCDSGEWKTYFIDDVFPGDLSEPVFTKNNDHGIWVGLLEKAYAKLLGSYQAIGESNMLTMLATFTGAPCERIELEAEYAIADNRELLWNYLTQLKGRENLILATFRGKTRAEGELKPDPRGNRKPYSFAVLDVRTANLPDGSLERFVRLRNRWGAHVEGQWLHDSKNWTPELKKTVGYQDEGHHNELWLSFTEFLANFSELNVAKIDSDFAHTSITVNYTYEYGIAQNVSFIWVKVDDPTPVTLLFTQKDQKQHEVKNHRKDHKYSHVRVAIGRLDEFENICAWKGGDFRADYQIPLELYLEKGEYMLVTEAFWENKYSQQLTIGAYSHKPIWLEIKAVSSYQYQLYLEQLAVAFAETMITKGTTDAVKQEVYFPDVLEIRKYTSQALPGLWFSFIKNESHNYVLHEELKIALAGDNKAVLCLPDFKEQEETVLEQKIEVLERSDRTILFKITKGNPFEVKVTGTSKITKK